MDQPLDAASQYEPSPVVDPVGWPFGSISPEQWSAWPQDLKRAAESHLTAFIELELERRRQVYEKQTRGAKVLTID